MATTGESMKAGHDPMATEVQSITSDPLVTPGSATTPETVRPDEVARDAFRLPLIAFLLIGSVVALTLGVYSAEHRPTGYALNIVGFSGPLYVKAWLTSFAAALGVVQLLTAGRIYDAGADRWTRPVHRWSGRIAVVLTLPVLVHCVYAVGFQAASPRVLAHSLFGCFFYGAFVAKMLVLTGRGQPRWVVPVVGGMLFTALIGLWLTSSLWVFTSTGFHL